MNTFAKNLLRDAIDMAKSGRQYGLLETLVMLRTELAKEETSHPVLPDLSKFCIAHSASNTYLVAASQSYGTQGGVGRIWSESVKDALLFESEAEAQAALVKEWPTELDRKYSGLSIARTVISEVP